MEGGQCGPICPQGVQPSTVMLLTLSASFLCILGRKQHEQLEPRVDQHRYESVIYDIRKLES